VIGIDVLWHARFEECLQWIDRVLKPGGQMLFFEPNSGFLLRSFNELRAAFTYPVVTVALRPFIQCEVSQIPYVATVQPPASAEQQHAQAQFIPFICVRPSRIRPKTKSPN
jgi:hypothetical protein